MPNDSWPSVAGMNAQHCYDSHLVWEGSTGTGVRDYPRTHRVVAPPAHAELALSADPHFRGDGDLLNPEQLVVMAASSCQLLSFLALAAAQGLDVVSYVDEARGVMPEPPVRLTRIDLTPVITVGSGTEPDAIHRVVEQAHRQCYVANSLTTEVVVTPTVVEAGRA